jgi:hypothetical protein
LAFSSARRFSSNILAFSSNALAFSLVNINTDGISSLPKLTDKQKILQETRIAKEKAKALEEKRLAEEKTKHAEQEKAKTV